MTSDLKVELLTTTKCTLKCSGCHHYIPIIYATKPSCVIDIEIGELNRTIELFLDVVDSVAVFTLTGGEAFLHPDLFQLLDKLYNSPKVINVAIFTNGTLIPKGEQLASMRNTKTIIKITDYGKISKNLDEIIKLCKHNHISYTVIRPSVWLDCTDFRYRERSVEQLRKIYQRCTSTVCKTIHDGKFYTCPHVPYMNLLEILPEVSDMVEGCVDLAEGSRSEIKERIRQLYNPDYIIGCNYCDGTMSPRMKPPWEVNYI